MRRGFLGIILMISVFLISGCGEIKPQEVSAQMGVSIARRGTSRITPVPANGQFLQQTDQLPPSPSSEPNQLVVVETPQTETPFLPATQPPQNFTSAADSNTPFPQNVVASTATEESPSTDMINDCTPETNFSFESELIRLINEERENVGLAPLSEQSQLTQAARLHSADMACNQFFSHISPENGDVEIRVAAQGYQYTAIGENIAGGYDSPASVVEVWMNSTGHRANILNGTYTQIGAGYVYREGSNLGAYWTLLIGAP